MQENWGHMTHISCLNDFVKKTAELIYFLLDLPSCTVAWCVDASFGVCQHTIHDWSLWPTFLCFIDSNIKLRSNLISYCESYHHIAWCVDVSSWVCPHPTQNGSLTYISCFIDLSSSWCPTGFLTYCRSYHHVAWYVDVSLEVCQSHPKKVTVTYISRLNEPSSTQVQPDF